MRKKLLIIAHYYAPDKASTGQILKDLAEGMKNEFDIDVVCTVPSYTGKIDDKYKKHDIYQETINGINVYRIRVSEFNKSHKLSRIRNLLDYFFGTRRIIRLLKKTYDFILTISQPPILGGILGVYAKKRLYNYRYGRPKLIYCIQDFNPEQIKAVGYFKNKVLLKAMLLLDKRNCLNSNLVITVGRDLGETLKKRFKGNPPEYTIINNWIDDDTIYPLDDDNENVVAFKKQYGLENKHVIMYSGNIGLYYDLEGIIKVIKKFRDVDNVVFVFIGEGSILNKLVDYKIKNNMENVVFLPYQDKEKLIYSLNAADVHWCVNAKGIKGVSCPSKFYGIIAVGKPVLAVLEKGSEVEMLINEIGCGLCCEPEDYENIERNIRWFINDANAEELTIMGKKGHEYLKRNLTKKISIKKYIEAIKGIK